MNSVARLIRVMIARSAADNATGGGHRFGRLPVFGPFVRVVRMSSPDRSPPRQAF